MTQDELRNLVSSRNIFARIRFTLVHHGEPQQYTWEAVNGGVTFLDAFGGVFVSLDALETALDAFAVSAEIEAGVDAAARWKPNVEGPRLDPASAEATLYSEEELDAWDATEEDLPSEEMLESLKHAFVSWMEERLNAPAR